MKRYKQNAQGYGLYEHPEGDWIKATQPMIIQKTFRFEAAHSLPHLPEGHKCRNCHGHSYGVTVSVCGDIDPALGWVTDYGDISAAFAPIYSALDHHNLNEVLPCITTAENLSIWIAGELKKSLPNLCRIEIQETPTSNVIYDL